MDYAKPYKGVQFFGLFADETADTYGCRDALAILAAAVDQTADRDLQEDQDTREALAFLIDQYGRLPAARAYQAALSIQHPIERREAVRAAYNHLCRVLQGGLAIDL